MNMYLNAAFTSELGGKNNDEIISSSLSLAWFHCRNHCLHGHSRFLLWVTILNWRLSLKVSWQRDIAISLLL